MPNKTKQLLIIDSNSLIHRAYHALPPLTTAKQELVNAVYGFLLIFLKALKDFRPDFVVATFDLPGPTFRHKQYKAYKAKRPKAPDDLYQQIPIVKEVLKAFGVPIFEKAGFEADDLIGTLVTLAPKKQVLPALQTIILSGDLDTLQLVNDKTKVYLLRKGVKDVVLYDTFLVEERFQGLKVAQVVDYKALRGDASDNIPGVTGIGEKTAIKLLLKYDSLDQIYKSLNQIEKDQDFSPRVAKLLKDYKEQAFLSRDLVEINRQVPLDFNLKEGSFTYTSKNEVINLFKKLNFDSLIKRVEALTKPPKETIGKNLKLW